MPFHFNSQDGDTPLMAATQVGQIECIRILVKELGCDKEAQNKACVSKHKTLLVYV